VLENLVLQVAEAKFKTFGCGSAIASSSVATEWMIGKSLDECLTIKNTDIAAHLNLPPVKLHCSMLAEDAIQVAIKDVASKQGLDLAGQAEAKTEEARA
jgi:nitrogen fixation NifU-like protein